MNKIKINPQHKGAFTAKAKRAGLTVATFANAVMANTKKHSPSTVAQANFAKNARGWSHK